MAFDNFANKLMHLLSANEHVNQVKQNEIFPSRRL